MLDFSLDSISVASPCSADWNVMIGDHQKRFCQQCQLNVYNLSGMTQESAEALIQESEGQLCVRFFRRADGTVLTQDCPVGINALYRRRLTKGLRKVAAVITVMTAVGVFWARPAQAGDSIQGNMVMGEAVAPVQGQAAPGQITQGGLAPISTTKAKRDELSVKKACKPVKKPKKVTKKPPVSAQPQSIPASEDPPIMGKIAAPRN